jgi:hypothetical protein
VVQQKVTKETKKLPHTSRSRFRARSGSRTLSGPLANQSSLDSEDANLSSFGQVVFPNADDAPTGFSEHPIHLAIPRLIRDEFLLPKGAIVGRDVGVFRTGVPETAVHKNRKPRFPKNEVRFAEHFLIPTPSGDAGFSQQSCQRQLRFLVAASANPGHDLGTFLLREYIRHERNPWNAPPIFAVCGVLRMLGFLSGRIGRTIERRLGKAPLHQVRPQRTHATQERPGGLFRNIKQLLAVIAEKLWVWFCELLRQLNLFAFKWNEVQFQRGLRKEAFETLA